MMELARGNVLVDEEILEFCENWLGFKPTAYQTQLFYNKSRFSALRWCRQSGKSTCIAALILHHLLAHPGSRIAVLAPALRQAQLIIDKINRFLDRLPKNIVAGRLLRGRLELTNRSLAKALPNSPETIRGETLDMVFIDEFGFVNNDEELYDAVVYTLSTTNGRFIAASTPGSRDSVFYKMCTDDTRFGSVYRQHVTWREAQEPDGPLKREFLAELRKQTAHDYTRWQREMDADFAEDEDVWLPMSLIMSCVDPELELIPDSFFLS